MTEDCQFTPTLSSPCLIASGIFTGLSHTTTLLTLSNLNKTSTYVQKSFDLTSFKGQSVTIKFTGTEDSSLATSFVLDDVTLTVQ